MQVGRKIEHSVYRVYAMEVNDLDNPPTAFILNTAANPKGFPYQLEGNGCIVIQNNFGQNTYTAQLAFGFGSDKIAIRRKYNGTNWTDWKYGTLSQSIPYPANQTSGALYLEQKSTLGPS